MCKKIIRLEILTLLDRLWIAETKTCEKERFITSLGFRNLSSQSLVLAHKKVKETSWLPHVEEESIHLIPDAKQRMGQNWDQGELSNISLSHKYLSLSLKSLSLSIISLSQQDGRCS